MDIQLKDDLLMGAAAIAEFMGVDRRQIYHLVAKRHIPAFKLGDTIAARKSSILKWVESAEVGL